jgi:hypothetical protein
MATTKIRAKTTFPLRFFCSDTNENLSDDGNGLLRESFDQLRQGLSVANTSSQTQSKSIQLTLCEREAPTVRDERARRNGKEVRWLEPSQELTAARIVHVVPTHRGPGSKPLLRSNAVHSVCCTTRSGTNPLFKKSASLG